MGSILRVSGSMGVEWTQGICVSKEFPHNAGDPDPRLYFETHWATEKAMVPHSSTLAWKIPWMEEPGRLQSRGSLRVGHDWATSLSLFTFMHWRRKWHPLQCSCLENPRNGGGWWAAIYGVAQSQTQLKRLSSSSSSNDVLGIIDEWYH